MAKHKAREEFTLRDRIHEIIFEADTPLGKLFDVVLLIAILVSILCVILESVSGIESRFGAELRVLEWIITILFTFEYILRIYAVSRPWQYIFSFYGLIDFLSLIPTYLSLFLHGTHYLAVLRSLRLLRIFRIFKLARYLGESAELIDALRRSRIKITVFLGTVVTLSLIIGSVMYVVEGPENGFTSIPIGIYWAIVTLTTVGYGDITPVTQFGKTLASIVMLLGYGIIAVPTGIVTSELTAAQKEKKVNTIACPSCGQEGHESDAEYCKYCGDPLH